MPDETDVARPGGSRAERIAEVLQDEIVAGGLATGARLGLRTELIARFGASPSATDEALRLLRDRGLVTVRPGPTGGVFVADQPAPVRLGVIDAWFSAAVSDPRELFAARVFLDDAFAALAVTRAEPEDVRALAWALDEMRAAHDEARAYLDASMRFHLALARASRLSVVVGLYETVVALLRAGMTRARFVGSGDDRVAASIEVHEGMLAAVRDGDAAAMGKLVALHGADLKRLDE